MTHPARILFRAAPWIAGLAVLRAAAPALGAAGPDLRPAQDVIRAAVVERIGEDATVTVTRLDVPVSITAFRTARPDPDGRLGHPIRFTLTAGDGTSVIAVAEIHAVLQHVVTRRPIARGEVLAADDIATVRDEVIGTPLRRLPAAVELIGGRVLRPMTAAAIVLPGSVVVRRAVEPGDHVTVVAMSGLVEVSAEMVAADGGRVGDLVRVVNPETRQYLRGRIVTERRIEVTYVR